MKLEQILYILLLLCFSLSMLLSSCNPRSELSSSSCSDFKEGTFQLIENDRVLTTIYRFRDYQIEEDSLLQSEYDISHIQWDDHCGYILKGINDESENEFGDVIIEITEMDDQGYFFTGMVENIKDYRYSGRIEKVDTEVKKVYKDLINHYYD